MSSKRNSCSANTYEGYCQEDANNFGVGHSEKFWDALGRKIMSVKNCLKQGSNCVWLKLSVISFFYAMEYKNINCTHYFFLLCHHVFVLTLSINWKAELAYRNSDFYH